MKTKAVRLYGKKDLRLEEFELPEIKDDEILAKVVSDSICMSSYKASEQGADHKRIPADVRENPVIIGHEFCGELIKVGSKWASKYKEGSKFVIQPALNYKGSLDAPGLPFAVQRNGNVQRFVDRTVLLCCRSIQGFVPHDKRRIYS